MGREVASKRCTMLTCVHRDPPGILSEHHKSALVVGQGRALIKVCVRAHRRSADSVSDERQLTKLPREVQKRRSRGNWELLFFMQSHTYGSVGASAERCLGLTSWHLLAL